MPYDVNHVLKHADAAAWALGALDSIDARAFEGHLRSCGQCRAAVAEFEPVANALGRAAPAVEPPDDLEARTIASVLAAAAEGQSATKLYRIPQAFPAAAGTGSAPAPAAELSSDSPEHDARPAGAEPTIIRFPRWRGHGRLLVIAGTVAAAIIAAALIILPGRGGLPSNAVSFALGSPAGQAASGTATDRPDVSSGSWDITLNVRHLKNLGDVRFYECWYVGPGQPGHRQFVSAGTFVVEDNGAGTFSMTSAVDPHQFPTMEITAESPGDTSPQGPVILTGTART